MIGTKVVSIHDDSPCPVVGTILVQFDDETVLVGWASDPYYDTVSHLDELMPHGQQLDYVTIVEPTPIHDSVVADMPRLMRGAGRRGRHLLRRAS